MNNSIPESVSKCACDCGTGQIKSTIACPVCRKLGSTVNLVTPQNTVQKALSSKLDPEKSYHFCDNPDCDVVYYNEQDASVFTTSELKNRVTLKDDSLETPLCYCFKVFKKHALEEIARNGTTDVFETIQAKMKPGQSCFCEKSNPRGDTCVEDIQNWLIAQGVASEEQVKEKPEEGCCSDEEVEEKATSGCCGEGQVEEKTSGGCCG